MVLGVTPGQSAQAGPVDDPPYPVHCNAELGSQSLRIVRSAYRPAREEQLVVLSAAQRQIHGIDAESRAAARKSRLRGQCIGVDLGSQARAFEQMSEIRGEPVREIDTGRSRFRSRQALPGLKAWLGQPRQSRPHPVGTTPRQRCGAEHTRHVELVA